MLDLGVESGLDFSHKFVDCGILILSDAYLRGFVELQRSSEVRWCI